MNLFSMVLCSAFLLVGTAAHAQAPRTIRYDGRLEQNGRPADGGYDLGFALFDAAQAGNQLWPVGGGTFATVRVTVSNGQFVVELGGQGMEALGWQVFAAPRVFVETRVNGTGLNGRRAIGAVPFAVRADNGTPVGGLLMWWHPNPNVPVPAGYVLADGAPIVDPDSPLVGEVTPNLIGRFALGVDRAQVGEVGGSARGATDLSSANLRTARDGEHTHQIFRFNGADFFGWDASDQMVQFTDVGDGIDLAGGGNGLLAIVRGLGVSFFTRTTGSVHSHAITQHGHDYDKTPPYVGLLPLIRVR